MIYGAKQTRVNEIIYTIGILGTTMQLSFDILDHIFSFVPRWTLAICSKDPILSPIVEKHYYYHVTVCIKDDRWIDPLEFAPSQIAELVSEKPHIKNYTRVLQIENTVADYYGPKKPPPQIVMKQWDEFAKTLLTFPLLESIRFTTKFLTHWPAAFRAALGDRLKLPTVKEVQCHSGPFPFSLLSDCGNIKSLSLSNTDISEDQVNISTFFQLESLALLGSFSSSPLLAWIKLQISELQSLRLQEGDFGLLSELLGLCSGTLKTLVIDFQCKLLTSLIAMILQ